MQFAGRIAACVLALASSGCGSNNSFRNAPEAGAPCSQGDCCQSINACNLPPAPPFGGQATSITTAHNYAIHTLYLGDTDRAGYVSTDAWKSYGFNLDDKVTTASSTDVCTLVEGAPQGVQIDGNGGIDNSWGANVVPLLETIDPSFSRKTNVAIQQGAPTQLWYVVGFDDSAGNTTTATKLSGVMLAGARFAPDGGAVPTWDQNTHWPIDPALLTCYPPGGADGCDAGTDPLKAADVKLASAYQQNGMFVDGTPSLLSAALPFSGQSLTVNIHSAIVTFGPKAPGAVTNGTIAGVINADELIAAMEAISGAIGASLCSGSAFSSFEAQMRQFSDIAVSGDTVSNPAGTPCNGITIGIGFDATEIALPTGADIAGPQPAQPNPCGDGG